MIITIDGPAGAGKSSVAKTLAKRLGFQFLDTGAMYRAVTWAALNSDVDIYDHSAIADLASRIEIEVRDGKVLVDGREITAEIRTADVTNAVSEIADNLEVREFLVMRQREIASNGDFVCEGRDQGTIVFPNAECKIFLTATSEERAKRRFEQLQRDGVVVSFEIILTEQEHRDQRDQDRTTGRLLKADDAIELLSDGLEFSDVVDRIEEIARSKIIL